MNTTTKMKLRWNSAVIGLHYLRNAVKARRWYREIGYEKTGLPCLSCTWEHEPQDTETPWHWIYCDKCDWGNS